MKIETLSSDFFRKKLLNRLLDFGGLRSPGHIEYFKCYYSHCFEDLSFGVFSPVGEVIVLLTRHLIDGESYYTWYGQPSIILSKGTTEQQSQVELVAQTHLRSLLQGGGIIDFQESIAETSFISRVLLSMGVPVRIYFEQNIKLASDELMLSDMRKVFRQNISWGSRHLDCHIIDAKTLTEESFQHFEKFHMMVSGRRTRSHESWLEQMRMVQTGENFLISSYLNDELVGMSLFAASGMRAYYSVGVYNRDLFKFPLSHYPIWLGIQHSRNLGCKEISMGESMYCDVLDSLGNFPTEKECNISHFKRGFGGDIISSLRFYGKMRPQTT